jgi:hypothetical protein
MPQSTDENTLKIIVTYQEEVSPGTWLADISFELWVGGICVANDVQTGKTLKGATIDHAVEAFAHGLRVEFADGGPVAPRDSVIVDERTS